jgi:phosphopantetheine binding protein/AMP-binding enzyme
MRYDSAHLQGEPFATRHASHMEASARADSQVKVRGYRIELSEIESALRAVEGVDEAVVIARGRDGGEPALHAYVTLRAGAARAASAIRALALERLPAYMALATVTVLPALPLNDNGKVDRRALQDRPERDLADATPPRPALETRLCALWRELLRIERLGVHDDVFELGATSLQVFALLARLQPLFGDGVTPELLLEAPTVAELAARLEAAISPRA